MDTNKILSADILDLVFDDRNKEYGAYELRKSYNKRITKSLLITAVIAGLVFTGSVLASTLEPDRGTRPPADIVFVSEIPMEVPEIVEPLRQPEQEQPRTEAFTVPLIVMDILAVDPLPTHDELQFARIGDTDQPGSDDTGLVSLDKIGGVSGIIELPEHNDDDIVGNVQVPARYDGNWQKFLTRHLNADVPFNNGAPVGAYKILIQFVVDKQGNVSDIKALTSHGYGMEEEAIRVLRKATDWKAGIQNGREVKSYHKQPITFIVENPE